ncbi:hypothetical protein ABK905_14215 [Acerihabitans sp. KWT182]|uniref:F-box domain-containing protein n=1 Tax=Acerihabitans sp. KWT182 TaxID=3157919 RepID=A0AAU7Q514_9GAMM
MIKLESVNQPVTLSPETLVHNENSTQSMAKCLKNVTQLTDLPAEIILSITKSLNAIEYSHLRATCSHFFDQLISISDMEKSLDGMGNGRRKQRIERMLDEKVILPLLRQSSHEVLEVLSNISDWSVEEGYNQFLRVCLPAINGVPPRVITKLIMSFKRKLYKLPPERQFSFLLPVDCFQYFSDMRFFCL